MAETSVLSKRLLCCHKHSAGASANLTRFLDLVTLHQGICQWVPIRERVHINPTLTEVYTPLGLRNQLTHRYVDHREMRVPAYNVSLPCLFYLDVIGCFPAS